MFAAFMVLSFGVFTSCGSDNDDDNNDIVGKWSFKKYEVAEVKTNSVANDSKVSADITKADAVCAEVNSFRAATWNFKEDGTIEFYLGNKNRKGTYKYTSGKLEVYEKVNEDSEETTYYRFSVNIVNGVLIFNYDFTLAYNSLELDELISLGVTDINNFDVLSASVKINNQRQ